MNSIATPMPPLRPAWKRWLVDSAPARMVLFVLSALVVGYFTNLLVGWLGWVGEPPAHPLKLAAGVLQRVVPTLAAYLLIVWAIERRRAAELAWRKVLPHGALGLALGALLVGTTIGILWLGGQYRAAGTNADVQWARALLIPGLATAIAEEIIFRGVLFRITRDSLGLWPALAISALFFGGAHIANPGATLWTSFAIAVEAGVLLGLLYHASGSLPLCMGVHMAWNFTQGAVFGSAVSGTTTGSWLKGEFLGPDWLTGGSFGIEGSVVMVLLSLAASALLLAAHRRRTAHNGVQALGAPAC